MSVSIWWVAKWQSYEILHNLTLLLTSLNWRLTGQPLCAPTYPWKQTAQVTLKIVRYLSRWCVGRCRGPSRHSWDFGVLLPTHYFDRSPLQVALRAEGCQLESGVAETARLAGNGDSLGWGSLKYKEDFFFLFWCKMTLWVGQSKICVKKNKFCVIHVISRVRSWQGFVRCGNHVRAFHWMGSAA